MQEKRTNYFIYLQNLAKTRSRAANASWVLAAFFRSFSAGIICRLFCYALFVTRFFDSRYFIYCHASQRDKYRTYIEHT